jgi:hypothetical protein
MCNDPPVFAQVRLLISMIDRSVPVFSCPGLARQTPDEVYFADSLRKAA